MEVIYLTEVISVRFRGGCKAYFFDPQGVTVHEGDEVVVETAQGAEFGTCVCGNHEVVDHAVIQPLRPMHRIATDEDRQTLERNRKREQEAFAICEKKIAAHSLEMKLVNVECSFDGSKIIFFFTADGRVDFRELVKDLAGVFHSRIELRQIGVRDEAKMLGGLGICGQPFCCKRFLDDFQPVSIKMAKTQNLSLNPTKIFGSCGRLMCCLKYEQNAYEDAMTRMPKNDSFVQTPDGPGNISAINLVRETVTVRLDDAPESPKTYQVGEIIVLRNGKGSRDGIAIPDRPERIEKEPDLDQFGMEIITEKPAVRQFRNAPPLKREHAEESSGKAEKRENKNPSREPAKDSQKKEKDTKERENAEPAESAKIGERTRRSHRGGRGRRGGEHKENRQRVEKAEKAEKSEHREAKSAQNHENTAQQGLRPLRFGSSIPIAASAAASAAPAAEQKETDKAEHKGHRRGRRPSRRGRGGRGSGKPTENGQKEN